MAKNVYLVNKALIFNLESMYNHLKVQEYDAMMDNDWSRMDELESRLDEIEKLMEYAPYPGCAVTWEILSRLREISKERNMQRYQNCINQGMTPQEANLAIF